jgi:hypothetical protein
MGLFSKVLKAPLKLHKKAAKVAKKATPGLNKRKSTKTAVVKGGGRRVGVRSSKK